MFLPFLCAQHFPTFFALFLLIVLPSAGRFDSAPKWEWDPPEVLEMSEDESVDLQCPARGRPQPLIRWSFNAVPFHELPEDGRRILLDQGRLLRIRPLKRDLDTGLYQCNATNSIGHLSAATFLNVQAFAPRFRHSTQRVWKVLRNAQIDLNCEVEAAPKPQVHWVDANDTQIQTVPGKLELLANHSLRLYSASSVDDGFYYCNVSNKYGLNRAMNRLEIFNPTFFTNVPSPSKLAIDAFDSLELRCRAVPDSRLTVDYVWTRNGRPTEEKATIKEGGISVLELKQARGRASGRIECAAITDVDVKMAAMDLLVKDVPEPPELIRVDCSSAQHALLVWRRPEEHGSPLTTFSVEAKGEWGNSARGKAAGGGGNGRQQSWERVFEERLIGGGGEHSPRKELYKTAIPLQPWVNYTFRLFAHNEHGPSEPTTLDPGLGSECRTPEDVPFQNPLGVVVAGNEPDNLVIRWKPLARHQWNGQGLKYLIRYRRADLEGEEGKEREWTEFFVEDPFANQTIIREQPTFRPYQVQIRAVNSLGFSPIEPEIVWGYSGEDVPLEVPTNLHVLTHHNFSSVEFQWEPVSASSIRGHFRGYRVDFWLTSRPFFVSSLFASNTSTSQIVAGLEALHNYTAKVHALNGQYESGPSNLLQFRTWEGAPSKVHNLRVHAVGSSSILVTWEPPQHPNGNLRGYFLAFENGSSGLIEETYVLYRQQFYLHEQLTPSTSFRVAVWAETGGGEGPRIWRHTRTWPLRDPDPPLFSVRPSSSANSLRIHWLPAGNGTIWRMTGTSFAVNYSRQGNGEWTQSEWIVLPQTVLELDGLREGTDYWLIGMAREGAHRISHSPKAMAIRTESSRAPPPFSQERFRSAAWFLAVLIASSFVLALAGLMCAFAQNAGIAAGTFAAIRLREKRFGPSFRMDSQETEIGGPMDDSSEWLNESEVEAENRRKLLMEQQRRREEKLKEALGHKKGEWNSEKGNEKNDKMTMNTNTKDGEETMTTMIAN